MATRAQHEAWALELTALPSASGHEWRVERWIERWVCERPELRLSRDEAGNIVIAAKEQWSDGAPVYITGHTDHPAFVVHSIVGPGTVEVAFRGGVMDVFFENAPVVLFDVQDKAHPGRIVERSTVSDDDKESFSKRYVVELEGGSDSLRVGDVGTWAMDKPGIGEDAGGMRLLRTIACDDLAAVAAALCAMDELMEKKRQGEDVLDVRVLLTRAEEIGFVGAIAACKLGTIEGGARVIALENSRASAEAPIGGGPIVRVGDRVSVFSPGLTGAISKRAEEVMGTSATPRSTEQKAKESKDEAQRAKVGWQRKLMTGGACEASAYCAYGYEATCVCLPLGNYHNMAHLDELQAGTYDVEKDGPARAALEYVSLDDFHGMVDLLVGIGTKLESPGQLVDKLDKMYDQRRWVLDEKTAR